jgi:hypothetical protein
MGKHRKAITRAMTLGQSCIVSTNLSNVNTRNPVWRAEAQSGMGFQAETGRQG